MKQYRLSDLQKIELVNKFETGIHTFTSLSKEFNISPVAIGGILRRRGYKAKSQFDLQRKYPINEFFFDEIDTQEKAYFLGILYADGYNNTDRNAVNLCLCEKDKEILIKLNNLLQPTKPLQYVKKSKYGNCQDQYRLVIANRRISQNLLKYGCVKAKSFILSFPEWLSMDFIPHFVRGYWDGDGWIGKKSMSAVSTSDFCNSLSAIFTKELNINTYIKTRHPERGTTTREIVISGRNNCIKIINWMYENSTIHLERKFNAAANILSFGLRNSGTERALEYAELPSLDGALKRKKRLSSVI